MRLRDKVAAVFAAIGVSAAGMWVTVETAGPDGQPVRCMHAGYRYVTAGVVLPTADQCTSAADAKCEAPGSIGCRLEEYRRGRGRNGLSLRGWQVVPQEGGGCVLSVEMVAESELDDVKNLVGIKGWGSDVGPAPYGVGDD